MIGQRIKEIRNNNNLTQEELADGIISRTYLSLIEKGSVHPSTNVLIKLSERLNCSVNDFMQEVSHFRYNDVEILREIAYYEQKIESDDFPSVISFIEKEYEMVEQVPPQDSGRIHLIYAKYYNKTGEPVKEKHHVDQALRLLSTVSVNQSYIDAIILKTHILVSQDEVEEALDLLEDTLYIILRLTELDLGTIRVMFEIASCYHIKKEYFTSERILLRLKKQSEILHIDYKRDTFNLLEAKNMAMLESFEKLEKMTEHEDSPSMVLLNCYASFNNGNIKECKSRFKSMGIEKSMFRGDVVLTGIYDMLDKRLDFI
ncbi:helix-turn-helix domain-containing protein [Salinicoccus carnicancri]|uniref:helix-turn-helix domain-containing protein n=1 Tax=Salinicoccus carnicancri TaxID=558170 RepID=UPI0003152965|nr:helix-turn-helix transcriptional regulator [Salinicoccus carnicancri]